MRKMINANIACCMDRKPYSTPRCEELDIFAGPLLIPTSLIEVDHNNNNNEVFNGTFDAPELMGFEDIKDDYDE